MQQAFLALANYFLAALMLVYNIQAFYAIRLRLDSREKKLRIAMKAEEVAVFFICYSVLFLESGRRQYFIFLILTLILILGFPMLCRQVYPKKNGLLLDLMMFLLGLGIVVLSRMDMGAAARQLSIEAAALVISPFRPLDSYHEKFTQNIFSKRKSMPDFSNMLPALKILFGTPQVTLF